MLIPQKRGCPSEKYWECSRQKKNPGNAHPKKPPGMPTPEKPGMCTLKKTPEKSTPLKKWECPSPKETWECSPQKNLGTPTQKPRECPKSQLFSLQVSGFFWSIRNGSHKSPSQQDSRILENREAPGRARPQPWPSRNNPVPNDPPGQPEGSRCPPEISERPGVFLG